jgi:2'-5' RNA ligase
LAETALIFPTPEAEPYVRDLRDRYDPAAADGVPAHITVLYPFIPFEDLSNDVLRRVELIAAKTESFDFHISSTARFPDTFYLQPDPDERFINLTLRIVTEFPAYPPYAGRFDAIVPHLTVAHGAEENLLEAERQFRSAHPALDFRCRCDSLVLIEKSSGRWLSNRVFPLGKQWI